MSESMSSSEKGYTPSELMIVVAARALANAQTVFVGVGMPNIACNLSRRTVALDLELIYESGVCGAQPERLPLSIGDPTLVTGATSVVSMADLSACISSEDWLRSPSLEAPRLIASAISIAASLAVMTNHALAYQEVGAHVKLPSMHNASFI